MKTVYGNVYKLFLEAYQQENHPIDLDIETPILENDNPAEVLERFQKIYNQGIVDGLAIAAGE